MRTISKIAVVLVAVLGASAGCDANDSNSARGAWAEDRVERANGDVRLNFRSEASQHKYLPSQMVRKSSELNVEFSPALILQCEYNKLQSGKGVLSAYTDAFLQPVYFSEQAGGIGGFGSKNYQITYGKYFFSEQLIPDSFFQDLDIFEAQVGDKLSEVEEFFPKLRELMRKEFGEGGAGSKPPLPQEIDRFLEKIKGEMPNDDKWIIESIKVLGRSDGDQLQYILNNVIDRDVFHDFELISRFTVYRDSNDKSSPYSLVNFFSDDIGIQRGDPNNMVLNDELNDTGFQSFGNSAGRYVDLGFGNPQNFLKEVDEEVEKGKRYILVILHDHVFPPRPKGMIALPRQPEFGTLYYAISLDGFREASLAAVNECARQ